MLSLCFSPFLWVYATVSSYLLSWNSFSEYLFQKLFLQVSLSLFVTHCLSIAPIILYLLPNFTKRVPLFYLGKFYRLCNVLQLPKHPSWSYENKYTLRPSSLTPWGNILLNTVFGLPWNTYISTYFLRPQPPQSSHLHFSLWPSHYPPGHLKTLLLQDVSFLTPEGSMVLNVVPSRPWNALSPPPSGSALFEIEKWEWKSLSRVLLFATPWTIQSMEFSAPFTPKHILVFHHHTCWNLLCTQSSINLKTWSSYWAFW